MVRLSTDYGQHTENQRETQEEKEREGETQEKIKKETEKEHDILVAT